MLLDVTNATRRVRIVVHLDGISVAASHCLVK